MSAVETDAAGPIAVRTIDHVTVVVGDLESSRVFYVGVLGMVEVPRPGFSFDGLWFQSGPTQIHLILEHEGSGPSGNLVPAEFRGSRTHHFAFQVDDVYACVERLRELDVPVVAGPKERPDGAVQVFVCDPDGHVVELTSMSATA
ncbi:MAG TPA: glyoxalase [Planctomycetaceae bacterium]|nr:glyoxalase [Planctomycetaceae bacterium]HCK54158.1 glyoxalase [Planctomycetaceae bacterium]|tara:strand:+ start:3486 stop:3920 length:435 start_codon:yes stop_codon:yes gene_type:complete